MLSALIPVSSLWCEPSETNPPEVPVGLVPIYSWSRGVLSLCFLLFALFCRADPTDYLPMVEFDLPALGRNILLIVAILSVLVIGEMILVSAEEPVASFQQQASYKVSRPE